MSQNVQDRTKSQIKKDRKTEPQWYESRTSSAIEENMRTTLPQIEKQ